VEAVPVEAAPVEAAPVEAAPVEAVPVGAVPARQYQSPRPRGLPADTARAPRVNQRFVASWRAAARNL
jgi:ribonuclease E